MRERLAGVGLAVLLLILAAWITRAPGEEQVTKKSNSGAPSVHVGRLLDLHWRETSF